MDGIKQAAASLLAAVPKTLWCPVVRPRGVEANPSEPACTVRRA